MSVVLAQCQATPDVVKQLAVMDAQLDAVTASVQSALDDLSGPSATALAQQIQSIVDQHNTAFMNSVPGSLDSSLRDAGVTPIKRAKRDYEKAIEVNGFIAVNGKAYSLGSIGATSTSPSIFQVAPGLASNVELAQLLGVSSYSDPILSIPSGNVSTSNSSYRSSTGTYLQGGTLDLLRELLHGFGGDLAMMKRFLDESWSRGCGIVWSIPWYDVVEKSDNDPSALTFDWVREKISYPAYDEEITLLPEYNKALVYREQYVRDTSDRLLAEAVARDMFDAQGIKGTPSLFCRIVRFSSSEDVTGQSPTLRTSGFDATQLGPNAYKLGITVNGLSRVIDVTGDYGTRQIYSQYTTNSVAAAIQRVFGPYLKVSDYGGELGFTTGDYGPNSTVGFFMVGDGDAASALGVDGAIVYSASSSLSAGDQPNLALSQLGSVTWAGGSASSNTLSNAFVDMVLSYGLTDVQVNSAIGGGDYWSAASSSVSPLIDSIERECKIDETIKPWLDNTTNATRSLESLYGFVDLVDLKYREVTALFAELGVDGLLDVLVRRPEIDHIDLYEPQSSVQAALLDLVQRHVDASALDSTQIYTTLVSEFKQNRAKIATWASRYEFLLDQYRQLSYDEAKDHREFLCSYISSTEMAGGPLLSSNGNNKFDLISLLGDAIGALLYNLFDPNLIQHALSAAINAICSIDPIVCEKIKEYWNDAIAAGEGAMNTVVGWVESGISAVLGPVNSAILWVLTLLNNLLIKAQQLVLTGKRMITSAFQKAFRSNKMLPEILEDLANIQYNVYGNQSFQTKFVSCYVSASGSVLLSQLWTTMMDALNGIIKQIDDLISKYVKSLNDALDVIMCLADKLSDELSGFTSYTKQGAATYLAGGLVPTPISFTLQCTMSVGASIADPAIAREIAQIKQNINMLGGLLKLNMLRYNALDKSVTVYKGLEITESATAATMIEQLRQQIQEKLQSLLSC